jgi:hypothetical protein
VVLSGDVSVGDETFENGKRLGHYNCLADWGTKNRGKNVDDASVKVRLDD